MSTTSYYLSCTEPTLFGSKCRLFLTLEPSPQALQLKVFHSTWKKLQCAQPLRKPRASSFPAKPCSLSPQPDSDQHLTDRTMGSPEDGILSSKRRLHYVMERNPSNRASPECIGEPSRDSSSSSTAREEVSRSLDVKPCPDPSQTRCLKRPWLRQRQTEGIKDQQIPKRAQITTQEPTRFPQPRPECPPTPAPPKNGLFINWTFTRPKPRWDTPPTPRSLSQKVSAKNLKKAVIFSKILTEQGQTETSSSPTPV